MGAVDHNLGPARYRRDVDGMRAVAVILVILYHLQGKLAPAGFVGVDIFFVISGFVITRSALSSPAKTPIQAVGHFWRRRILRIVPASLFLTIGGLLLLGTATQPFPVESYRANVFTVLSSVFGMANMWLFRGSSDYFNSEASQNLFTHTWSLGVEEQFYFLFAVLFIGGLGFIKDRSKQVRVGLAVMSVFAVISYATFLKFGPQKPVMVYYCVPFRFWEIATGCIIAYSELKFPAVFAPRDARLNTLTQLFAVGSLVAVIWTYKGAAFPTAQISVAVLAAAVLIVSGSHGTGLVSGILSKPFFVGIGLISYSLYLWHYPVLQYCRNNLQFDRPVVVAVVLLVMVAIATFSYFVIERRLRYSKAPFASVLLPSFCLVLMATVTLGWTLQSRLGVFYIGSKQTWNVDWRPPKDFAYGDAGRIQSGLCTLKAGDAVPAHVPRTCISGSNDLEQLPMVFVIGDSHAYADWGMVSFGASAGKYRFATLTHDGCTIGDTSKLAQSCRAYWDQMPALVENTLKPNDSVMIASYWPKEDQAEIAHALDLISRIARAAKSKGAEVIVEAPLPVFSKPAYLCTKEWYRTNYDGCTLRRSDFENGRTSAIAQLQQLTHTESDVRIWDPLPILCPDDVCGQFRGETPIFRDTNHLSYYGAKTLGPQFIEFLRQTRNAPKSSSGS